MESENVLQILNHPGRQGLVRVEVVSLRFALHLLSLVHLGVAVATAQGLQLTQDILKTFYRCIVVPRLRRASAEGTNAKE